MSDTLKLREKKVFFELLKNGRAHDKYIAKKIDLTQPTVTRIRQRLERKGFIKGYCANPAFDKVGISLVVITLFTWEGDMDSEKYKNAAKEVKLMAPVISASSGEGLRGKNGVIVSAHANFKSYEMFIRELKKKWGASVNNIEQFIFSVDSQFMGFNAASCIINALSEEEK